MAKQKPYKFTSDELQRLKAYHDISISREEIIGLWDKYSACFADWSVIINEAVQERITQKQQSNEPCEEEREMLKDISFLFTKMAYFSDKLHDWHEQIAGGNKLTEEMIEKGKP